MQKLEKNLQRLTFRVRVASPENSKDPNRTAYDLSFIYGIGTDGLCDFEMAIDGLGLQEVFTLEIDSAKLTSYFGWLYHWLASSVPLPTVAGVVKLQMELLSISTPEPREIVTALAKLQSHGGCGSDCGCGCQ